MHIQTDRAFVAAASPTVRYLQVLISAPPQTPSAAAARPPVSVALVLDRSGSMAGSKIEMARAAVDHAVRLLKPTDYLGVVCYDEEITTVLDRTLASREAKTLARERLAAIDARGATDLSGGWLRGSDLAKPAGDFEGARRILKEIVDDLRALAPGDQQVRALIDQLHHDELEFGEMMAPMAMKAQFTTLYQMDHSREEGGTARRTNRSR